MTYGVLAGLEFILEHRKPEAIRLIGGGARSESWRQLVADAAGSLIHVTTAAESGCVGAAIQVMWAWKKDQGVPEPLIEHRKAVQRNDPERTKISERCQSPTL